MKQYTLAIILLYGVFFQACTSSTDNLALGDWKELNPKSFNEQIKGDNSIKDVESLVRYYYFAEPDEEMPDFKVTANKKHNNQWVAHLVVEGLMDDSVKGEQILMVAEKKGQQWKVISIKKNWKCYPGRGHQDWTTELCH